MEHGTPTEWKEDKSAKQKSKLGIIMFLIYFVVYAGFIIINVVDPQLMKMNIGSLNLAIVYGFGLIVFALILALIYNHLCSKAEKDAESDKKEDLA